jgi:hypothetical protein
MAENLRLFGLLRRFWSGGLREIARPVVEFEIFLAQVGIKYFDAYAAIRAVAILV